MSWIDREIRQAPLSLRWETKHMWSPLAEAMGSQRGLEAASAVAVAVALALFAEAIGQGRWTSYSRSKTHYAMPRRYRTRLYTYRQVVGAVDELVALDLVYHEKAPPGQRGWQSAISATPDLVELVRTVTRGEVRPVPLREPIVLRDGEKNPIDYYDNRMTDRMRRQISAQNEAIMGMGMDFGKLLPFPGRLRRIFNGSFDRGGRFYAEGGSWQTLSKAERQQISIGGEPVIEIDYSAFHPVLAYAECGLPPPAEPYGVPGFERDLVKIAFNILLNSSGRPGARHEIASKPAMAHALLGVRRYDHESLVDFGRRLAAADPRYAQRASLTADQLIKALLEKHAPISAMFFTGAGARLQRRDSDIAEAVMAAMRRQGVAVLPIHDSFLAPASKAHLLEEAMIEAAEKHGATVQCKRSPSVAGA